MIYKINLMPKIRLFCNRSLEEKKEINIDGDNSLSCKCNEM